MVSVLCCQKIGRVIVTENVWNELSTGGSHKWFLTYFRLYLITLEPGAERTPQADGGDDTVSCHASQRSLQAAAQICFPPVWFIGRFLLQFVSGAILLSCLFLHLLHLRYNQDAASFLEKLAVTERFTISFKKIKAITPGFKRYSWHEACQTFLYAISGLKATFKLNGCAILFWVCLKNQSEK